MKNTKKKLENSFAFQGRIVWLFTKYQLLSKGLLALLIYPVYSYAIDSFLRLSGRTEISSGDYLPFILSFNGAGFLLATLFMMSILIGLDINTFILSSALIKERKVEVTAKNMLVLGLSSLRLLFSPIGLILMIYISLIFPILGLGVTIGPMRKFQIPHFITSVIFDTPLYLLLYLGVLLILTYVSYRFIFSFHYVLICKKNIREALKSSFSMTKKHGFSLIKRMLGIFIKNGILYFIPFMLTLIVSVIFVLISQNQHTNHSRFFLFFIFFAVFELTGFLTFLFPPTMIYLVTDAFYDYELEEGRTISLSLPNNIQKWQDDIIPKVRLKTKFLVSALLLLILSVNFVLSYFFTKNFSDIFRVNNEIELVAHRGGGNLGAENTLEGILAAAKEGISWSEIDIQRTKDGHYILNHDASFKRVAGNNKTPGEMTLEEIKQLQITDVFDLSRPSRPVATLEEVIKACKGKIGLFIELKGKTADKKMVDEVVSMVKAYKIEKEVVLLSLDYSLITYIEEKYPDMVSGYLYYFSIGKTENLKGDYLIMEESQASPEKIYNIKTKGKKVIVWTVNTSESIKHFANSEVDGIITDYPLAVRAGIKAQDERSDFDIIIDTVFGE